MKPPLLGRKYQVILLHPERRDFGGRASNKNTEKLRPVGALIYRA